MRPLLRFVYIIAIAVVIDTGCDTEALHEMNINPESVNEMDVNYLLTYVEYMVATGEQNVTWGTDMSTNIQFCGHLMQHFATPNSKDACSGDKYIDNIDNQIVYQLPQMGFNYYILSNACEIIRQTGPGGYAYGRKINTRHAARILKVFCEHRLTDWYGNIPYFDAYKGISGNFNPKYDKQKDIYTDLLKELDEACAGLGTANFDDGFAAADLIFKGDISKWKKWGYSLMLRLAMRVSNVDKTMADTYVARAVAGGVMESNDDNPWVPMDLTNMNPISVCFSPVQWGKWSDYLLSRTFVDWLMGPDKSSVGDDDPRLMIFTGGIVKWTPSGVTPFPGGTDPLNQKGLPNGLDQTMLNALYGNDFVAYEHFSSVNPLMMKLDAPYQLMNAAECQFLMAEALERNIGSGISGTSKEHYELGVRLAMQLYVKYDPSFAVSDERVSQYLSLYPYGVAKPALEMIGEQMWASKFMNWWEAWSDWRRTGYPVLIPVNYPGNSTNGQIPTKLPLRADISNPNYASGVTRPDELTGKVWWDGGPE